MCVCVCVPFVYDVHFCFFCCSKANIVQDFEPMQAPGVDLVQSNKEMCSFLQGIC